MKHSIVVIQLLFSLSAIAQQDSITYIRKETYPITNEMLRNGKWPVRSMDILSFEQIWFKNKDASEIIVIGLGTDLYRTNILHIAVRDLPAEIWQYLYLSDTTENRATAAQIKKALPGFIKQARTIDSTYFVSKKRVQLGITTPQYAINLYGKPDSVLRGSVDKYVWRFEGDIMPDMRNYKKHILVKDSFGYSIIMYFKQEKLIAQMLKDDMP
jgi:hypothetical protein